MGMEGIQIGVDKQGAQNDIAVVKIQGYIDTTTSSELERVIQNLLRERCFKIVVDLHAVDYISSAGWGIFISEIKHIRTQRGDLKLAGMSENVSEVYELLEFSTILTASPAVDQAIALFEQPPQAAAVRETAKGKLPKGAVEAPATVPAAKPKPEVVAPAAKINIPANTGVGIQPPVAAAKPPVPKSGSASIPTPTAPKTPAPVSASAGLPPVESNDLMPLIDRIQVMVRAHPEWGAWKIKTELNRRRGQQPKVGWGEVRTELKFSGLESKPARYRFARGR